MTRQEMNKTIGQMLGYWVLSTGNDDFRLHTLAPPQKKVLQWTTNVNDPRLQGTVEIVYKNADDAWHYHCPCFFTSEHGLFVLMDWLFENKYNIIHTRDKKIGIRKRGVTLDEGAYISYAKVEKELPDAVKYAGLMQPTLAMGVYVIASRWLADKMAKEAAKNVVQ